MTCASSYDYVLKWTVLWTLHSLLRGLTVHCPPPRVDSGHDYPIHTLMNYAPPKELQQNAFLRIMCHACIMSDPFSFQVWQERHALFPSHDAAEEFLGGLDAIFMFAYAIVSLFAAPLLPLPAIPARINESHSAQLSRLLCLQIQ